MAPTTAIPADTATSTRALTGNTTVCVIYGGQLYGNVPSTSAGTRKATVINLGISPAEQPEQVLWIDPTHPHGGA